MALRHAERLATVSTLSSRDSRSKFDRAAFAALRDVDLSEVAAGVCAAGPAAAAAAAALEPLLRLHPRAMFSCSTSSSLPPAALRALSSLPETTPVAEVVALLRLVVEASKEAAAAAASSCSSSSFVIDACERSAVTAALEAAGVSGSADLLPTEAAIADRGSAAVAASAASASASASSPSSSSSSLPPISDEQVAEWACARSLAVDARTGQLGAAAALLDAVATLLVDRGSGKGGGNAAERVAALAEAARELSAAAAASPSSGPLDACRDASSNDDDDDDDAEDEDGEEEADEDDGEETSSPPSVLSSAWTLPLAAFASAPPLERARVLLGGDGRNATARGRAANSLFRSIPSQEGRDEAAAALLLSFGGGNGKKKKKQTAARKLSAAAELVAAEAGDLRLFSSHERLAAACVSAVYSLTHSSASSSTDLWGPALALLHVAWRPLRAADVEQRRRERAEERRRRQEEREEKRSRRKKAESSSFASVVEEEEEEDAISKGEGQGKSADADGWEDASIASAKEEEEEEEEEDEEESGSSSNAAASSSEEEDEDEDDYHFFDVAPPPAPGFTLSEIAKAAAACRAAALLRSRRLGGQLSSAAQIRDASEASTALVASFVAAAVAALRGPPAAADSEWVEASVDLEDVRAAVEAFGGGGDDNDEEGRESSSSSSSVAAPLAAGALACCRWRAARTLLESLPPSLASAVALSAGVEHLRQATSLSDDAVAHAQQCLGLAPEGDGDGDGEKRDENLSSARRALAALRRLSDFGVDVSSPASFLDPASGDRMEAISAVIAGWAGAPREPGAVLRLAEDLDVVRPVPASLMARHDSDVDAEAAAAVEAAALDPRRVQVLVALGQAALRAGDADAAAARAAEAASAVSVAAAAAAAAASGRSRGVDDDDDTSEMEHATAGAWRLAAAAADALLQSNPSSSSSETTQRRSRFLRAFALAFAPPGDALADLVLLWDQARGRKGMTGGNEPENETRLLLASRLRRAIEDPWRSSSPAAPLLVAPLSSRWPRGSLPAGRPLPSCGDAAEALAAVLALGPAEGAAALAELASAAAAGKEEGEEGDERFSFSLSSSSSALPPAGARVAALLGAFHAGLLLLSQQKGKADEVPSLLEKPPLELWASASASVAKEKNDPTSLLLLSAGAAAEQAAAACSSDRALQAALPGVDALRWRSAGARGKAFRASALAAGAAAAARASPETRREQPPPLERLVALAARTDGGEHRWRVAATYACELLVSLGEGGEGEGGGGGRCPSADAPLVRAARDELRSLRRRCGENPAEWGQALLGLPWRALSPGNAPQMALWLSSMEDAERGKAKVISVVAGGGAGGGASTVTTAATSFATAPTNASNLSFAPSMTSSSTSSSFASPSASADALASLRKSLGLASRARPGLDTRALAAPAVEAALGGSVGGASVGNGLGEGEGDGEEEEEVNQRPSESLSSLCGVDSPWGPPAVSAAGVLFRAATELAVEAAVAAAAGGDNREGEEENAAVAALQDLSRAVDSLPCAVFASPSTTRPSGDAVRLAAACRLLSLSVASASASVPGEGDQGEQEDGGNLAISPDDAYDLAVAAAAGCSPASAAALARFALGGPPPREVVAGFEEAAGAVVVDESSSSSDPKLWVPAALPSSPGLPLHVRARAAADGEAALRSSSIGGGEHDGESALSLALAADELAAAGARARALCALRDGGARLGDDDVAAVARAMDSASGRSGEDSLRALVVRGVGFARLAAAARALGLSAAHRSPGDEFAAAGAALTSVLSEAALCSSSDEDEQNGSSAAAAAVQGVMASLAAPAPTAPTGALAAARDAAWRLLLSSLSSSESGSCSVAALEALSSLASSETPWRGWRPPAEASGSLELVRLAALSSAAVAKGSAAAAAAAAAGGGSAKASPSSSLWRFSAANLASAESARAAFLGLLTRSDSRSLPALGSLLSDVWLDGRVFPPADAAAPAAALPAVAFENGGGENSDEGDDGAPVAPPLPPSSSAVPPLISSCYRSLLVEMLSRRGEVGYAAASVAAAALRVADAAAARGATLLPAAEDALAVCRSCCCSVPNPTEEDKTSVLLLGASLGALLAPLEASAEQVAAAAAAGAEEAAKAAEVTTEEEEEGERAAAPSVAPPSSSPFDSTSAAASLVAALVARGSVVELAGVAPALLDTAFGRLLAVGLPEIGGIDGDGGGEGNEREEEGEQSQLSDWRACSLPAAAACLASAGHVELASGVAARHAGQSDAACGHLSASLPLLRAYLRSLVLPPLCDPRGAPQVAAAIAAPAPAPGAVAAVWRGLPGAAVEALRVLDEATAAE